MCTYRFAIVEVPYNIHIHCSIRISNGDDGNKGDDDDEEFDLLTKNSTSSDSGPKLQNIFTLEAKHETITRIRIHS